MLYSRINLLLKRLISGDIVWFFHHFKLALGLRGLVPHPVALVSKLGSPRHAERNQLKQQVPIKIMFFSHNLSYEGASISLKELVLGLAHRGNIDPTVITFKDGPLRADYELNGIIVKVLPNILHEISTIRRLNIQVNLLASLIKQSGAGLVFANTLLNFPAILASELANVPSIWNPRESESCESIFRFLPDPVAQRAIAAIGLPKKVIFVAQSTKKVWSFFDVDGRFEVIHNGINLARFPLQNDLSERARCRSALGIKGDAVVIICVGPLCDRKGQIDLVEAFSALPKEISSRVQILLVGENNSTYAKKVKNRCYSLPNIKIFPNTQLIANFYTAADIYVLSSKVESFPRVILEAMAFGLPILATPVFGVLEQVIEGENAFLYPPGDSRLLAGLIERLVVDDLLRVRMGKSSLKRISQLITFDEMIAAYERICIGIDN